MNDLERHLRETLAEAADHVPLTHALAIEVEFRERHQRRQRWTVVAAAAAAIVVLLGSVALSGTFQASRPISPATGTESPPPPDPSPVPWSCAGTVAVVSSAGERVLVGSWPPPQLTVRVGDVLTIEAAGACAPSVSATPQSDGILIVDPPSGLSNRFRAVSPGTVEVAVTHAACAEIPEPAPDCRGGIVSDGLVEILVLALP